MGLSERIVIVTSLNGSIVNLPSAIVPPSTAKPWPSSFNCSLFTNRADIIKGLSVSPYYTVGFADFNGKATSGGGVDIGLGLSKTIQFVSFLETDKPQEDAAIDRFGAGIQMTGKLGKWLKPYGRFSVGYAVDGFSGLAHDEIFLRPEFGASIDVYREKNYSVSLTGAWCLDVDTDGHAAQRLKAALSISF